MFILKEKGAWMNGIAEKAAVHAPELAQHRNEMAEYQKWNALDKETGRQALFGKLMYGSRAIANIPVSVASQLIELYPEIYWDTTGKSMLKFLNTDEGKAYKI